MVNRNNTDRDRIAALSRISNDVIKPIVPTVRMRAKAITQSDMKTKP
ncbi:hypothetical protein MGH68_18840 [Erysipelothrix sp. D19-032]